MSSNSISVLTGHLGSGHWRLKQEDGLYFMAHPQPFSRRTEFRIGPDQVEAVSVESEKGSDLIIRIEFTGERYCRAQITRTLLPKIESMVEDQRTVSLAKNQQKTWAISLGIFALVCILIELFK